MFIERLEKAFGINTPIFTDEILKLFSEFTRAYVFRLINTAESDQLLICFTRGVYYLPKKSFFGQSSINSEMIAEKKYIENADSVYGVYSGLLLLNRFGITTQIPNRLEIVTNNEATRKRIVDIEGKEFILRKSRCEITKENYPVYTILQLFTDIDENDVLDSFSVRQIKGYIASNGVKTNDIYSMAMFFPAMTLKKLMRSCVLNGIIQG